MRPRRWSENPLDVRLVVLALYGAHNWLTSTQIRSMLKERQISRSLRSVQRIITDLDDLGLLIMHPTDKEMVESMAYYASPRRGLNRDHPVIAALRREAPPPIPPFRASIAPSQSQRKQFQVKP